MTFSEARDRAAQSFAQSTEVFLDEYQRRFGNIFNADSAAELLPDYKQSPETRATFGSAVHPTSRAIRDTAFERALRSNPDTVLFTSGGSAAGKSTIAPALASIGPVYDSTLSDSNGAQAAIARALQACSRVLVIHVRRPIGDSFAANLDRALSPNGCGRTVNITSLMRTHRGADETLAALLG